MNRKAVILHLVSRMLLDFDNYKILVLSMKAYADKKFSTLKLVQILSGYGIIFMPQIC